MNRGVTAELAKFCAMSPERSAWLARLPETIREFELRWSLQPGEPFAGATCAWVAAVKRADDSEAVVKFAMPHMEAEQEIEGLRFWDGDPTVRLFEADDCAGAMLLERCQPGTSLRERPEEEQDIVIADLLRRLWRTAPAGRFRSLGTMLAYWSRETLASEDRWVDAGLVRAGLRLFEKLSETAADERILFTDLHAGNVLRAQRAPWLAIDPKPFTGDPAYDATQHLLNCEERLQLNPNDLIRRFADLVEQDAERIRLWMFARTAAEPRQNWRDLWADIARRIGE